MFARRIRLVPVAAALVVLGGMAPPSAGAATPRSTTVPYQYVAKLFTEGRGRLPTQPEWRAGVTYFEDRGCRQSTLAEWGSQVLEASSVLRRRDDGDGRALVGYRAILNRDPTTAEATAARGRRAADLVRRLYASDEFHALAARICDPDEPSTHFGTTPAPDLGLRSDGFAGSQAELQAALNATPAGGTVRLAQRAVVRLTSTLVVPPGVTLTTEGAPEPAHYADMGRLVRSQDGAGFKAPMIQVKAGGRLVHVWVDGQLGDPGRYIDHSAYNVQTLSGSGTQVSHDRLGNPAGGTNLSALGESDTGGIPCVDNDFSHNLVDAYGTSHWARLTGDGGVVGPWSDGLSIACEDSRVSHNQIVDATDVGLIVFNQPGLTQRSKLTDNVILSAGNPAFGGLASQAGLNPTGVGDEAGEASTDFTGTIMARNLMWTSPAAPSAIGIAVGVRPWTAGFSYNGHDIRVQDNTSGTEGYWSGNGIVVSGMLDVTVTGNRLHHHIVDGAPLCTTPVAGIYRQCGTPSRMSLCEPGHLGADLEGFASGEIQGTPTRRSYSGCVVGVVHG